MNHFFLLYLQLLKNVQTLVNPYQKNSFGQYLTSKNSAQNVRINYIYGFQGQEMDDEVKGEGNSVNYTYRMHDPRIGRFFAVDPLAAQAPGWSPYSFCFNNPIMYIDEDGREPTPPKKVYVYNVFIDKSGTKQSKLSHSYSDNNRVTNVREYRYFNSNGDMVNNRRENIEPVVPSYMDTKQASAPDPMRHDSWEGGANSADSQNKQTGKDIAIGTGVASLLTLPFVGPGIAAKVIATLGAINAVDDLFTNHKGESLSNQLLPNSQSAVNATKTTLTTITLGNSIFNMFQPNNVNKGIDAVSGTIDAYSIYDKSKEIKK